MHPHLRGCDHFRRGEGTDEFPGAAVLEVETCWKVTKACLNSRIECHYPYCRGGEAGAQGSFRS